MFSQVLGGLFAAMAIFGFLWMNIGGSAGLIPAFAIVSAATLAGARMTGDVVLALSSKAQRALPDAPPALWLFAALLLGIALRILVAMLFPPIPNGNWNPDMLRYFDLAQKLADGMDYGTPEGRAYWPPGLPLALALPLALFGSSAYIVYNIGTFIITIIATFALGRMLAGWRVGCLAAFFLAVWPNFVFAASLLNKECVLIALCPAAVYFYLKGHKVLSDRWGGIYALLAGALLGYSALAQPAALPLPLCLPLFSALTNGFRRRTFICVLAAACGVLAVLTPWIVRNYTVLHHFVLISSNGGGVFYEVTRPQSDGRFDAPATLEWFALSPDEGIRNSRGYSLGMKSILEHPLHFLSTVVKKPFYVYGQDIANLYWNLEHVDGKADAPGEHVFAYSIANGFYLGIILLISIEVMGRRYVRDATPALILLWMFMLYPMFVHGLLEAAERHHGVAMPFMSIIAAMPLCRPADTKNVAYGGIATGSEILSPG